MSCLFWFVFLTTYLFSPVKVTLDTSPKIGGGGLGRKYKAIEFHLHWGVRVEQQYLPGSEHSIDGEKQAMEVGETVRGLWLLLKNSGFLRYCCTQTIGWFSYETPTEGTKN